MKQESKGWIIANENHPSTGRKFLLHDTFAYTRKQSIAKFIEGSGSDWRYWYLNLTSDV